MTLKTAPATSAKTFKILQKINYLNQFTGDLSKKILTVLLLNKNAKSLIKSVI